MSQTTSLPPLPPGCQPITIINNINPEKKDEKKDKKDQSLMPEGVVYMALEFYVLHKALLDFPQDPKYRSLYLASMVVGVALGIYKSMVSNGEVQIEKRAECFAKGGLGKKSMMVGSAYIMGPGLARFLRSYLAVGMGKFVPMFWGASLGSDASCYVYNSLFSKQKKS